MNYFILALFFGTYITLRFFASPVLHHFLGLYGDYIAEAIFCVTAVLYYSKNFNINFKLNKSYLRFLILSLFAGAVTYQIAKRTGMLIPFNFNDATTVLLLVLIGPILEEFLFRFSLFWPLGNIFPHSVTIFLSAAFFSFCHVVVISKVPEAMHSFIYFQGFYTFLLGIWWARAYLKDFNLLRPIFLHITFNTGFYLGSFL